MNRNEYFPTMGYLIESKHFQNYITIEEKNSHI